MFKLDNKLVQISWYHLVLPTLYYIISWNLTFFCFLDTFFEFGGGCSDIFNFFRGDFGLFLTTTTDARSKNWRCFNILPNTVRVWYYNWELLLSAQLLSTLLAVLLIQASLSRVSWLQSCGYLKEQTTDITATLLEWTLSSLSKVCSQCTST